MRGARAPRRFRRAGPGSPAHRTSGVELEGRRNAEMRREAGLAGALPVNDVSETPADRPRAHATRGCVRCSMRPTWDAAAAGALGGGRPFRRAGQTRLDRASGPLLPLSAGHEAREMPSVGLERGTVDGGGLVRFGRPPGVQPWHELSAKRIERRDGHPVGLDPRRAPSSNSRWSGFLIRATVPASPTADFQGLDFAGVSYLVGVRGFEPPAPASRRQCSTRLSYTPTDAGGLARLGGQCKPSFTAPGDASGRGVSGLWSGGGAGSVTGQ